MKDLIYILIIAGLLVLFLTARTDNSKLQRKIDGSESRVQEMRLQVQDYRDELITSEFKSNRYRILARYYESKIDSLPVPITTHLDTASPSTIERFFIDRYTTD